MTTFFCSVFWTFSIIDVWLLDTFETAFLNLIFSCCVVDTPLSESRFADMLEGWVDEEREVHDEHDLHAAPDAPEHDDEDGHDGHDEHDEHDDNDDNDEHDDDNDQNSQENLDHEGRLLC